MCSSIRSSASALAARTLALVLLSLVATACASTGSTFRSGVGDRVLERPPFYAGAYEPFTGSIAHLPIAYQPGATQPAIFEPSGGQGSKVAALLSEMNAYLDSLRGARSLPRITDGTAPDVHFGCETNAEDECRIAESYAGRALGRRGSGQFMRLAVGRPSQSWIGEAASALQGADADAMLVITLEIGDYWTRLRGLRGDKYVELGTGYEQQLPWLTSLETPVSVLQLTGALIGRDGLAIRIGAEGLIARRTNLLVSSIGGQALVSDEDVERARTARRADLPGEPLVWQAALRSLVAELTGARPEAAAP